MIGDGMGLASLTAARYQKGRLDIETMPHAGFSHTHSLDQFVTDSAASATALGSGYWIDNRFVGLHPDGTPAKNIIEYAREARKRTGLVATSRITHATPASLTVHVKNRDHEDEIAAQMAMAGVDVILGGGWDKFLPQRRARVEFPLDDRRVERGHLIDVASLIAADGKPYGTRADGRDLVALMEKDGYLFVRTAEELGVAVERDRRKILGLFAAGPLPKVSQGRRPSLAAMSLAALRVLSASPEGFFLMIEGSQIDWAGHSNDYAWHVLETADFDDAIGAVRGYLEETGLHRETLLVVTADHETGGLTLKKHPRLPLGVEPSWSTDYHTGVAVPVFSEGPGAERFAGIQDHARIGRELIRSVAGRDVEFLPRAAKAPAAGGVPAPARAPARL
jgi:alkaline phosphatase